MAGGKPSGWLVACRLASSATVTHASMHALGALVAVTHVMVCSHLYRNVKLAYTLWYIM